MPKEKRMKASDVFRKTEYFLGAKTTFEKAFPEIKDIQVEVTEEGDGVIPRLETQFYTKSNCGEYIDCSNPRCYKGGFRLGSIVRLMVSKRKTHDKFDLSCQGYEGSPKGRKNYGPCENSFKVVVKIEYRPDSEFSKSSQQ
jgi:hypothetical protein